MATNNKDFKVKHGLVVEGLQGTINGEVILTETASDQYILDLIGGETLIKSVSNEFDVSVAGELSIDRATVNGYYDAAGAADTAEQNAKDYADDLAPNYDAAGTAQGIVNLLTTSDIEEGTNQYFTDGRARSAILPGIGVNLNVATGYIDANLGTGLNTDGSNNIQIDRSVVDGWYDASGAASAAQTAAQGYADGKIADLVNGAPELLDTLNELAAALQDNPDVITDLQGIAAGKQNTLTAGSNIEITGLDVINVTGLDSADISDFNTAAVSANTGLWDTFGDAAAAQTAAEGYASGLDSTTNTRIDNLTTDNVAEGTAQYFTDSRAKSSAADLLTNATLSNITITGTGAGLTITAENGVAGSTTSDLVEGSNLYFTDARAVDALEAVVPNFTAVELNSVAKQVAATLSAPTAGIQVAHTFAKAEYRSAEYLVKVAYGTHTEISKVLLTLDSSDNIAITEYGIVGTNGSASSVSAGISGSNVQLQVTTVNNNSTVTVVGTLLA